MEQINQATDVVDSLLDKQLYKRITVGVVLVGFTAYLLYKRYR
jgi:hypothetical protein